MGSETSKGLLLQAIPYLGQKKILKILTQDHGLISLMTRSSASPFCIAEWVYKKTQKELSTLTDFSLLDPLLELRQDYTLITAAGSMARDLLRTQMPNKPAPFTLACAYFKKLPLNPQMMLASFRLKLLIHEGLLSSDVEPNFSDLEWEQLSTLAFARQFSQIQEQKEAPLEKIGALFEEKLI